MNRAVLALAALLAGCDSGGMSTQEIRAAAIEKARQDFNLAAGAPLQATVWTGREYDGEASVCGTVSSNGGQMPPQRFLARLEPFQWLVFEGAHTATPGAQPGKFPEWQHYCGTEAARSAATIEE